ncbi:3-oxo-5-alpha-steroid 4-dehydrogenase family protein [Perilla frutescens var. hirtella]|uniref:3-oxo-5-alpha-steroid 4-dehydrogenase family protein n=1 Tax=Perilla frutescens var. hirtella TaxID=608512 RepID=A0AAD4JNM0_PERFH|nr:3-oxo-5-alpha-steroid 4-dehydrogenase family protein [Perilla frutescens var. frutescens]KAH6836614.1 3-oxo-5-alpha-steroid 4-dehydrogenase family protein [Perilla frutescens var. hirtella]
MPWLLNQASSMAVVSLLRAAWIAGTLPIVAASIPSSKINAFRRLLLQLAGRGKIMDSSSRKLSVPQKYFCHFYVVGVIWTTFLLVATLLYAYETTAIVSDSFMYSSIATPLTRVSNEFSLHESHSSLSEYRYGIWESVFLLLLMEAQVLRRLIESIYIFNYSHLARMHIAGYLTGLFFYTAAPLSLCSTYSVEMFKHVINLFAEFVVEGKGRMRVTEFDLWPLLQLKWYAWIGAAFFFWGWIHQRRCHAILGSLRENGGKVDEYAIPEGDWFEYVSSPHYLAEIVIYCGLAIASGVSDITIWLVVGFVVANLALAAGETHRWYIGKFDNYPRNRYAIIPLIY